MASVSICLGFSIVFALINVLSSYVLTMAGMFCFYCGEFSGILIASNSALIIALICVSVSSGVISRKMAISGSLVCYCMSDVFYISLKCRVVRYRRYVVIYRLKGLLVARG